MGENFDPMGIHTGESIVVAPSQTLSNEEYHMLRETAIRVVRHLGIIGECNIQYALHPTSLEYAIIEVNPRLSRSSALASKATGYPLAFVAAKIIMGIDLPQIKNAVTRKTTACFEPSLDYVVVKMPKWDLKKFTRVSPLLGSSMKSVGEVMAVGRTFEEGIQKALRMNDMANTGYGPRKLREGTGLEEELTKPTDLRIFAIYEAMQKGYTVDQLHDLTKINKWFLHKLAYIKNIEDNLRELGSLNKITRELMAEAKNAGFSDFQIASFVNAQEEEVRTLRKGQGVLPIVKQIDTLAGEFPAETNYLYMTYQGKQHDIEPNQGGIITLGSGVYRIGSSVEFDYCAVSCTRALRKQGKRTITINYNPETVSTDYDESDQLYFEELSEERVRDIYEVEGAEDRDKFSSMLDSLKIDQPKWRSLTTLQDSFKFAKEVSYPVLVRPSYVLSGAAMRVAKSEDELSAFLKEAGEISGEHPVVISKFIEGAQEVECDAVAQNGKIVNWAISLHIENAGVHSGDASMILPSGLSDAIESKVYDIAAKIAKALNISGPFNTQFLLKDENLKVIETNLRASRSFPFVSKTLGIDFVDTATRVFLGETVEPDVICSTPYKDRVCVKVPQFSYQRLHGADPVLSVEMGSTGEVACYGKDAHEAYLKGILSTNAFKIPKETVLLSGDLPESLAPSFQSLVDQGYTLYATPEIYPILDKNKIPYTKTTLPTENKNDNVLQLIRERKIHMTINVPKFNEDEGQYRIRRTSVDFAVPLVNNAQVAAFTVEALRKYRNGGLEITAWQDYFPADHIFHKN